MKENRKRQSTYPSLLFDGEADGIVTTLGLERYTGWKDSGLRLAWGKAYQDDDNVSAYLDKPGGSTTPMPSPPFSRPKSQGSTTASWC